MPNGSPSPHHHRPKLSALLIVAVGAVCLLGVLIAALLTGTEGYGALTPLLAVATGGGALALTLWHQQRHP